MAYYKIGGHNIRISVVGDKTKATLDEESILTALIPSFIPFKTEEKPEQELLFSLKIQRRMKEIPESERHLIRDVDTGNGMTRVDKINAGGYQFLVRDINGHPCALLQTTERFEDCRCAIRGSEGVMRFALNNALMLTFAFSSAFYDTLLIHASVVRHSDMAYAFTAKSGTGKSTQVDNWMRYIDGCDIMNDDNPIIRMMDGKPILFGSPWSGKTPCYRNIQAILGAIVLIERDDHNHVEPMQPLTAFTTVLAACSSMKWDEDLYQRVCKTVSRFVESTKVVSLHCLPDRESAEVCCKALEG